MAQPTTRKVTENLANEFLGSNGVFIYNLLDDINYEIPFVNQLKRGSYVFAINDTIYELYQDTYTKKMYNDWGKEYNQKQKAWGIRIVKGNDDYNIVERMGNPSEDNTNKDKIIDRINRDILEESIKPLLRKNKKIELSQIEHFDDAFNKFDKDDQIKALKMQIGYMEEGYISPFAFAKVFGFVPIKFGNYITKYINEDIIEDYRNKRRQKRREEQQSSGIGRRIRGGSPLEPIYKESDIPNSI